MTIKKEIDSIQGSYKGFEGDSLINSKYKGTISKSSSPVNSQKESSEPRKLTLDELVGVLNKDNNLKRNAYHIV